MKIFEFGVDGEGVDGRANFVGRYPASCVCPFLLMKW